MTFLGLLIPLLPLMGFLVNGLLGKYLPKGSTGWIGSLTVFGSFICTLLLFKSMSASDAIQIDLFNWIAVGNLDISFGLWIDSLTMIMLMVVTGVGFLIHLYSIGYMHADEGLHALLYVPESLYFLYAAACHG